MTKREARYLIMKRIRRWAKQERHSPEFQERKRKILDSMFEVGGAAWNNKTGEVLTGAEYLHLILNN